MCILRPTLLPLEITYYTDGNRYSRTQQRLDATWAVDELDEPTIEIRNPSEGEIGEEDVPTTFAVLVGML